MSPSLPIVSLVLRSLLAGLAAFLGIAGLVILPGRNVAAEPPQEAAPASGLVTIESDLQQADNATGIITATGNVRIVYPDQGLVATARQAQYYSREGRVVLSGDVDVVQGDGQTLRAERVVYLLDDERLRAEPVPGQQVFSKVRLEQRKGSAPEVLLP